MVGKSILQQVSTFDTNTDIVSPPPNKTPMIVHSYVDVHSYQGVMSKNERRKVYMSVRMTMMQRTSSEGGSFMRPPKRGGVDRRCRTKSTAFSAKPCGSVAAVQFQDLSATSVISTPENVIVMPSLFVMPSLCVRIYIYVY